MAQIRSMWDIPHAILFSLRPQRHVTGILLAALGMAVGAGAASGQSPGPSFDCAKARTVAERLICAEPELAKADRGMAASWRRAAAAMRTATDRDALNRGQVEWLKGRDEACFLDDARSGKLPPPGDRTWSVSCLGVMYGYRTSLLDDIATLGHVPGPNSGAPLPSLRPADLPGRYATGGFGWYGSMTIATGRAGLGVSIETVSGATAHVCSLAGRARIVDGRLVALAYHDEDQPKENERCTLVLTPIAGGFSVEGQEVEQCRFFCGARGTLSAEYYRTPPSRQ